MDSIASPSNHTGNPDGSSGCDVGANGSVPSSTSSLSDQPSPSVSLSNRLVPRLDSWSSVRPSLSPSRSQAWPVVSGKSSPAAAPCEALAEHLYPLVRSHRVMGYLRSIALWRGPEGPLRVLPGPFQRGCCEPRFSGSDRILRGVLIYIPLPR